MTDITMPSLTDGMEEGTIIKWLVADGDEVTRGQEIAEIETDKATVALEAQDEGAIQIVAPEGATLPVGAVIARLGADGATPPTAEAENAPVAASVAATPTPEVSLASGNGVAATPLARRIAQVHGVALDTLSGSGPRGRITKRDVLDAAGVAPEPSSSPAPAPAAQATLDPGPLPDGARLQPMTRMQELVAKRMTAQALVPVFQVQTDVAMDAALAFRAQLKAADEKAAPSVNDLIVRACAIALRDHPLVNGSYRTDGFVIHEHVNVGIAIAADAGLLVATIPDADTKSLGQIAREARGLASSARDGTITPTQLSGGTFTVSNLGMFGMTEITAVIYPPQAAILGVGATRPVGDEQLLALNLTCDHRILNGADGARFLQDVKAILESPLRLAL